MQWLFDIVEEMMEKAGFIKIGDVETYLQGMIVMWSGINTNVPDGWAICDGTNGTPDLRNRFVMAPLLNFISHQTGGSHSHDHDFTGDGHSHHNPIGAGIEFGNLFSTTVT
ncbi:tail fiber protein, partial [Candidatus Pacearchaeota archaeon]|nr:tail fiber protein [Candidatus Pacearchaeota archaeon]